MILAPMIVHDLEAVPLFWGCLAPPYRGWEPREGARSPLARIF
jgi:hypothetical protein